jgi:hypothetical protein
MSLPENISAGSRLLEKSVFLFGAGATRDAGCLVSKEMLDDIYTMQLSKPEKEAIDFLLSSLQYHASWKNLKENKGVAAKNGHQPNIEDLMLLIRRIVNRDSYLPFPITGSWADKINFLETEWRSTESYQNLSLKKSLFINLEDKLTRRLPRWLRLGNEDTAYLSPINEFLQETESGSFPLNFFTLNYDLVFEKGFNRDDVTLLNTGFTKGIYSGFDMGSDQNHRINYFKLHGSINWEKDDTGSIIERFSYSDQPNSLLVRQSLEETELIPIENFGPDSIGNPHVIFGQGGKFLSVDPFISLIYNFKELLNRKEIFFVIGYSFFDPYINNMLLEGLSKESSKLMVVVNPQFHEGTFLSEEELEIKAEEKSALQKNRFIDHLQAVQKSTYLSDLPSFNLTEISPNRVKLVPLKTKDFFRSYFSRDSNGFKQLEDEIDAFEREGDVFL